MCRGNWTVFSNVKRVLFVHTYIYIYTYRSNTSLLPPPLPLPLWLSSIYECSKLVVFLIYFRFYMYKCCILCVSYAARSLRLQFFFCHRLFCRSIPSTSDYVSRWLMNFSSAFLVLNCYYEWKIILWKWVFSYNISRF